MSLPFFSDFIHLYNTITLHHGQELPTLLTILIVDAKSGRFRYQSGRVGDEAKKQRKSPAKSGRVDISAVHVYIYFKNILFYIYMEYMYKWQKTNKHVV